jgi:hypothetical protein
MDVHACFHYKRGYRRIIGSLGSMLDVTGSRSTLNHLSVHTACC